MNSLTPKSDRPLTIRKSNELIEARYRLSIWEQRLIFSLLLNISPYDADFKRYRIRVADFAKQWQLESDNSLYEKVQEAADSLVGRTIQLSDDPAVSKTVAWLAYVEYVRGSGEVEMEFHSALKPYLLQLKGYYTEYQLAQVVNFRNQYTIRIYELLRMEVFKHPDGEFSHTFAYEELRKLLALGKKEYPLFADFRRWILEPATKEISMQTDLLIERLEYGKTGRKVTHITYHVLIRPHPENKDLQTATEQTSEQEHPLILQLVNLGFAVEVARKYKTRYGVKRIERNMAYALAKQQEGLVKDFPAYLNKAIMDDMGGAWMVVETKKEEEKTVKQARAQAREKEAELAHLKRLAELGGVSLSTLKK